MLGNIRVQKSKKWFERREKMAILRVAERDFQDANAGQFLERGFQDANVG